jgi:hypothetical protein
MLGALEVEHLEPAFVADPDLEEDLDAMLQALAPKRRALFVRRLAAHVPERGSPATALLPTLADIMRARRSQRRAETRRGCMMHPPHGESAR